MIALAALALVQVAAADGDPQRAIADLAFTPRTFFETFGAPLVEIRYLGDDYDFPVYSIAVKRVCAPRPGAGCRSTLMARMVRAPNANKVERPRWAGQGLVYRIREAGAGTPEAIASQLDKLGVEWLEADLAACPAAATALSAATQARWVSSEDLRVELDQIPPPPSGSHFDRISVRFSPMREREATFIGEIREDMPSGWATRFAAALEPCWRPAAAAAPWRRAVTPPPRAAPGSPPPP